MEWVEEFYRKHQNWTGFASRPAGDTEKEQVEDLRQQIGNPPGKILELGAGGGQFAFQCAKEGFDVVAVELVSDLAELIKSKSQELKKGSLRAHQGDFYEFDPEESFSAVCYWDGFGIGTDEDQKKLLKKICGWLAPGGKALIEIYSPWYWFQSSGQETELGNCRRKVIFDPQKSRFQDTLWPKNNPKESITQDLRCYSPAELKLLLQGTGLVLRDIKSGGGFTEDGNFENYVPLEKAIWYRALLETESRFLRRKKDQGDG